MEIRLSPREAGNILQLDLGLSARLVFTAISALLIGVWITAGSLGFIGFVILGIAIFGSLYSERWVFDGIKKRITSRTGITIVARTREWGFDEFRSIRALHYRSGTVPKNDEDAGGQRGKRRFFQRTFVRYELVQQDGQTVRIEIRRIHESEDPWELPQKIADRIGVPLEKVHA